MQKNFFLAETFLLKKGFHVINPLTAIEDTNHDRHIANRIKIKRFLHSDIAKAFGEIRSAGFCTLSYKNKSLTRKCFGESSTL